MLAFQKLPTVWDFHTRQALGFTKNGAKRKKKTHQYVAWLMAEVREEHLSWVRLTGKLQ